MTGPLARVCFASPPNPAPRNGKAKAEQDEPEHNGHGRAGTTGGPHRRQMHSASTDEQQSGGGTGPDVQTAWRRVWHHGRLRGRKDSPSIPTSGHLNYTQISYSGGRRLANHPHPVVALTTRVEEMHWPVESDQETLAAHPEESRACVQSKFTSPQKGESWFPQPPGWQSTCRVDILARNRQNILHKGKVVAMNNAEAIRIVTDVLAEIQSISGRVQEPIREDTRPIGDLDQFDSLNGVEATVELSDRLGVDLGVVNAFVNEDAAKALTVSEIADGICRLIAGKEALP